MAKHSCANSILGAPFTGKVAFGEWKWAGAYPCIFCHRESTSFIHSFDSFINSVFAEHKSRGGNNQILKEINVQLLIC